MYSTFREAKQQLQIGDVVIMRNLSKAITRRLIRYYSRSHWTHASIVFDVLRENGNVISVSLMELNESVQVHKLDTYEYTKDEYEIGLLRVKTLSEDERSRLQSLCVSYIDTPYTYPYAFGILASVVSNKYFHFKGLKWLLGIVAHSRSYICTTLLQRILYLAANPLNRRNVLFKQHQKHIGFAEKIGVINPRDISESPIVEWLYNKHL